MAKKNIEPIIEIPERRKGRRRTNPADKVRKDPSHDPDYSYGVRKGEIDSISDTWANQKIAGTGPRQVIHPTTGDWHEIRSATEQFDAQSDHKHKWSLHHTLDVSNPAGYAHILTPQAKPIDPKKTSGRQAIGRYLDFVQSQAKDKGFKTAVDFDAPSQNWNVYTRPACRQCGER